MGKMIYAIGDIHGDYEVFQSLLEEYDKELHQLVLIGDLGDRGPKSKQCFFLGKELVERDKAIYLKGNHEDIFLNFLKNPEEKYENYIRNGGMDTLNSLLHQGATEEYSPTEMAMMIKFHYKELITFLENLPLYYEWKQYIFVHAGVDLSKKNWRDTDPSDFMWIREPFHNGQNHTGKKIVFGHTITPSLHGDNSTTDLWLSDDKIGIDGGGVYGGSNHGVIFDEKGIVQDYEIQNRQGPWKPTF